MIKTISLSALALLVLSLPAPPALAEAPAPAAPAAPAGPATDPQSLAGQPQTIEQADPGPQGEFPPPPPSGAPRLVSAGVSVGPGWLALRDDIGRDSQRGLGMAARLSIVFMPEVTVSLSLERTSTDRGGATFAQTAGLMGAQYFLTDILYLGGSVGLAWVRESGVPDGLTDGPGVAASALVGFEALRTSRWAFTVELGIAGAQYEKEAWEMGSLRLGELLF